MQNEEAARGGLNPPEWKRLPSCALERIFSFLNPHDRASSSIVCKSWAETYECPSLWKAPTLSFSKGNRSKPCFNPQSIVRRFGLYFRHLTILCRKARRQSHMFGYMQMKEFFHMLVQAEVQLNSIRMPRLKVLNKINKDASIAINEEMINFLKMQTGLTVVDFTDGDTHTLPGLMLLESLVAENVLHLKLQRFFHQPLEINQLFLEERYIQAICHFKNLCTLSISYRSLDDSLMTNLANNLQGHLEVMEILMDKVHLLWNPLHAESWLDLKRKCPKLQVHLSLDFEGSIITSEFLTNDYLSSEMPIATVCFSLKKYFRSSLDSVIFSYFATNFYHSIKQMEYNLILARGEELQIFITEMIISCPVLENLTLRVRCQYIQIQELLDGILDCFDMLECETISLKVLRVTFRRLNMHQGTMTKQGTPTMQQGTLSSTYIPKFKEIGIQLIMKMKK